MSFVAIPGLVWQLIGPTLGRWLVQVATRHWVFLINIPVGLVGLAATWRSMPDNPQPATSRFDLSGYLLLAFGRVAVCLAIDGLSGLGLKQASVLVLLVFGLASLATYWLHAARRPDRFFRPGCSPSPLSASAYWAIFSRAWAAPACPS